MNYRTAREILAEAIEQLDIELLEGNQGNPRKGKKNNVEKYNKWAARHTERSFDSIQQWKDAHNRYRKRLGLRPFPNPDTRNGN